MGSISSSSLLGLLLVALASARLPAKGETNRAAQPLAITHVTVIDCTGAAAQRDRTVVIANGRISELGAAGKTPIPTGAQVVDATGKYLIPGLWDMHVHWYDKDYLPLFIANGVTGIRMMWGAPEHHEWRDEIEKGTLLGPRMLIASIIVDGPQPIWPGSITAGSALEGRQAVLKAKQAGADFVKVYSGLPRDAFFAIADECRLEGIPFEGHVPIAVSVEEASAAGQKTIEHLTGILPACSTREANLLKMAQAALEGILVTNDSKGIRTYMLQERRVALETYSISKAKALFAELKRNHTWQCPTLTVLRSIRNLGELSATNDSRLKYMPQEIRAFWNPATDERFAGLSKDDILLGKKVNQKELEIVGAMQRAGVGILAGTDTGNPYCFPGFSLHDEMGLLVQAGLTPMQALQAATISPARFMGRESEMGTIERGRLADIVLLDANPLENIANTLKINAVICRGQLLPRPWLDTMLMRVEKLAGATKTPIAEPLLKTLITNNVDGAIKQYHALKADQPDKYDFSEEQLNYLGYQLLWMKRTRDAVSIFKLNVEAYPQSSNVYDSLGEAYVADGDKERAIENYQKSLDLDPNNRGAAANLLRLKAYPSRWWAPVSKEGAPAWEILPQKAKPGEVILSKRNELGLLSNFAATPFKFHGKTYASLEGFWQAMKYPEDESDPRATFPGLQWPHSRAEVEHMTGFDAKHAGDAASTNMSKMGINWVTFEGKRMEYHPASPGDHYQLILEASREKVAQNPEVRKVLLATGDLILRPDHDQGPDPPAAWRYYEILMQIRSELHAREMTSEK